MADGRDKLARGRCHHIDLASKTVSNNISNVLLKVKATDRAKLMLMALEAGLGQKPTA